MSPRNHLTLADDSGTSSFGATSRSRRRGRWSRSYRRIGESLTTERAVQECVPGELDPSQPGVQSAHCRTSVSSAPTGRSKDTAGRVTEAVEEAESVWGCPKPLPSGPRQQDAVVIDEVEEGTGRPWPGRSRFGRGRRGVVDEVELGTAQSAGSPSSRRRVGADEVQHSPEAQAFRRVTGCSGL